MENLIKVLLLLLLPFASQGQSLRWFATVQPRDTDTAITLNQLKMPWYSTEDSNKVLGVDENGLVVLRTKGTGGGDADSSVFSTIYGVDTAKTAIRGEIITSAIANQSAVTQTATYKINGTGTAGNFVATKADGAGLAITNTNTSTTTYPNVSLQVTGQNSGGVSLVPKDATMSLNQPWTVGARGTALLVQSPGNMYFRTLGALGSINRDFIFYASDGSGNPTEANADSLLKLDHDGTAYLYHAPALGTGDTVLKWNSYTKALERVIVASSGVTQDVLDDSTAAIRAEIAAGSLTPQQVETIIADSMLRGKQEMAMMFGVLAPDSIPVALNSPMTWSFLYPDSHHGMNFCIDSITASGSSLLVHYPLPCRIDEVMYGVAGLDDAISGYGMTLGTGVGERWMAIAATAKAEVGGYYYFDSPNTITMGNGYRANLSFSYDTSTAVLTVSNLAGNRELTRENWNLNVYYEGENHYMFRQTRNGLPGSEATTLTWTLIDVVTGTPMTGARATSDVFRFQGNDVPILVNLNLYDEVTRDLIFYNSNIWVMVVGTKATHD